MEPPVLTDKEQFPTQEVLDSHLGKSKTLWLSVFEYLHSSHPDVEERWKYYNDGKSWLFNASRKKKTVFWLSVIKGAFRTTFYFTPKARQAIKASSLSEELKQQYLDVKRGTTFHGITLVFRKKSDIVQFKRLVELKLSMR